MDKTWSIKKFHLEKKFITTSYFLIRCCVVNLTETEQSIQVYCVSLKGPNLQICPRYLARLTGQSLKTSCLVSPNILASFPKLTGQSIQISWPVPPYFLASPSRPPAQSLQISWPVSQNFQNFLQIFWPISKDFLACLPTFPVQSPQTLSQFIQTSLPVSKDFLDKLSRFTSQSLRISGPVSHTFWQPLKTS